MTSVASKTLYLHIGFHKTGTTAIQSCLSENYDLFLKHGYHLPRIPSHVRGYHHNIAWELRRHPSFSSKVGKIDDLLRTIQSVDTPRVIVSSEEFCKCNLEEITRLGRILDAFDVKVIVYLRRQDQFAQAVWAQVTKSVL